MRKSKYPSLGIMDFIEKKVYGSSFKFNRHDLYRSLRNDQKLDPVLYSKKIYSLKECGFIEYANNQEFILTKKGLRRINFIRLEKIILNTKKRDGLWRIIIFDIPERQRSARGLFRDKLLEFNCHQLQKSVYITPYVCEKEITETAQILKIQKFVNLFLVKLVGGKEKEIQKYF